MDLWVNGLMSLEKYTCAAIVNPGGQAFLLSLCKSIKLCLSKYGKWVVGVDTMVVFYGKWGGEKHRVHLDDTDLVQLHHHLPKLCSDQDLTLLGD